MDGGGGGGGGGAGGGVGPPVELIRMTLGFATVERSTPAPGSVDGNPVR